MSARLRELYKNQIVKELRESGEFKNVMLIPRIQKIVVNVGVGEATTNKSAIDEVVEMITTITGQKPVVTRARKAISAFKVREGFENGVMVTLRNDRMWEFFDRLISVVFPRTKDFRGLSPKAFDGNGNYSIGIKEHTVFPEIDTSKITKIRSLQVTIVTNSGNDKATKLLLDKFGFPFTKDGN